VLRRALLLWLTLLAALPADALARAGGGTHSFHSPSFGGRSRGFGHGIGGHHFFFFGGGGGGGFLFILLIVVVLILISRSRRR
jgi:hypothetical protein